MGEKVVFRLCQKSEFPSLFQVSLSKYMVYILLKSSTFATSQVLSTPRKNKQFIHYYFSFLGIISPSATFPVSSLYISQERMEDKFLHNMKSMHANTHMFVIQRRYTCKTRN
jgi:hypothetical protein